jgi:hypothetical protein
MAELQDERERFEQRVAKIAAVIDSRLRGICVDMERAEFDALVRRMAEHEAKYERHTGVPFQDRR